jgi:glycosyltransferase involved in cell wall biosynthesis
MPKVSIIMNCYNGEEFLNQSIDSIFSQTFTDWELIFIDNCSTDKSAEIAKSFGYKIKYVKTDCNIPLYAARNIGLKYATGEFIAFLDVDDLWVDNKLEKQIDLFEDSDVNFTFTGVSYIDIKGSFINNKMASLKKGYITQSLLIRNFIAMSSSMIRATVIKKNIFNDNYNLLGDHDFWLNVSISSKCDYLEDKLLYSRIHNNSTTQKNKGRWIFELRKHYMFFLKRHLFKYPNIFVYIIKSEIGNVIGKY